MARHYSTKDFFRQMPYALLARYFHARGLTELRQTLMMHVPRSVVLVPSDRARAKVAADAENLSVCGVFDAATIEESKQAFVTSSGAVAVFANRYDGIDFSGRRMSVVVY